MKKYLIVAAVLLLVSGGLWLATRSQAQVPGKDTGHGYLRYYASMYSCSGTNSADEGHVIQWSTDGSTWYDGTTTGANGEFNQTLHLAPWSGTVLVRGKPNCNAEEHQHTPCTQGSWSYADNPGTNEIYPQPIYNKTCPQSR